MSTKPLKVLTSREGKDGRKYWTRLGSAWRRENGSISVQLDGLPVTGSMLIVEDDGERQGRGQGAGQSSSGGGEYDPGRGGGEIPF